MKYTVFLFLFLLSPLFGKSMPIVFHALLSAGQEVHKLYMPGDKEIPTPYYKKKCQSTYYDYFIQAVGSATFIYYPESHELHYAISYTGLSSPPLMLHLCIGPFGAEGPILQTIFGKPYEKPRAALGWREEQQDVAGMAPPGFSGFITGTYLLQGANHLTPPLSFEEELKALLRGGIYINLHTCLNQKGELRGQILPLSSPPQNR